MIGTIYRIYIYLTKESYVGMTTQDIDFVLREAKSKLRNKKHPCKPLQQAVNEHGAHAVGYQILEVIEGAHEELVDAQERHMKDYKCFNKKVFRKERKPRPSMEVLWDGVKYQGYAAASRGSGLTVKQLRTRLEMGFKSECEVYITPFTPDKKPMTWEHVDYDSTQAASAAAGISYSRMRLYRNLGITSLAQAAEYEQRHKEKQEAAFKKKRLDWLHKRLAKKLEEVEALKQEIEANA